MSPATLDEPDAHEAGKGVEAEREPNRVFGNLRELAREEPSAPRR